MLLTIYHTVYANLLCFHPCDALLLVYAMFQMEVQCIVKQNVFFQTNGCPAIVDYDVHLLVDFGMF